MPIVDLADRDLVQLLSPSGYSRRNLSCPSTRRARLCVRTCFHWVTTMSAGSKTNPGGYAGEDDSLEQFSTSDERSASEVRTVLREKGYDPVWKDWDPSYDLVRISAPKGDELFSEKEESLSLAG